MQEFTLPTNSGLHWTHPIRNLKCPSRSSIGCVWTCSKVQSSGTFPWKEVKGRSNQRGWRRGRSELGYARCPSSSWVLSRGIFLRITLLRVGLGWFLLLLLIGMGCSRKREIGMQELVKYFWLAFPLSNSKYLILKIVSWKVNTNEKNLLCSFF